MARYNDDATVSIPENATDIQVTVAGASGGSGGGDAGNSGGSSGSGRGGTFYFPSFVPRTLTLRVGKTGQNGIGCVSNGGNGAGGASNVASGGGGGRTGPQGCSGGGAGGGGASGVFDSIKNGWVIIAAGGGGGGGASYPDSYLRGGNGGYGLGFETGNVNSPGNGGTGSSQGFDGGGGGGGGGGCPGGGGGREGADDRAGRYASGGGGGGASGYDASYCTFITNSGWNNFGSGYINVSYILVNCTIDSFVANPTTIIRGQSTTLSWTTSNANTGTINQGVGAVSVNGPNGSGSVVVFPTETTTYALNIVGIGNTTDQRLVQVVVYIPPIVTLTAAGFGNADVIEIVSGECVQLSWFTTGDADTISFNPNINNGNLTSTATVCPTDSVVYTAVVSGLGGTDSDSISIIVYQPPNISRFVVADSVLYGTSSLAIQYEVIYANIEIKVDVYYNYTTGPNIGSFLVDTFTVPPAGSAQIGPNTTAEGQYSYIPTWDNHGPRSITYVMTASGNGGSDFSTKTTTVIIDETPDNFVVDETDEKIKDQDPVYTPETEIVSEMMLVEGIDIDVEIKANFPIQVDVNGQNDWKSVRQL